MRSLRRIDIALLVVLVPLWTLAVLLHSARVADGRIGWMPLLIEPVPDGPPRFREWLAGAPEGHPALAPGTQLLRVGELDLTGASRIGFVAAAWSQVDEELGFEVTVAGPGGPMRHRVEIDRVPAPWRMLPMIVFSGLAAVAVLLRGGGTRHARAWFLAGVTHGLMWATFFGATPWQTVLSLLLALAASFGLFAFIVQAMELFPPEVAPRTFLGRHWAWGFVALGPATTSWLLGWPLSSGLGLRTVFVLNVALAVAVVVLLTNNYRRASRPARRQLKWVLLGFYVALFPVLVAAAIGAFEPRLTWVYEVATAATVAVPIGVLIAIVRDDFLDIDRLVTETASYSIVSVLMLAVLLQAIPATARVISAQAQIGEATAQGLVLVALVAAAVPLRRVLTPWIDRLVYRDRIAMEKGLSELRLRIGAVESPEKLFRLLGEELPELLRCQSCVIYARMGEVLGPVVASGASVPPALDPEATLVLALEEEGEAVDGRTWRGWLRRGFLDGASRGLLESLAPDVVLPIPGEGRELAGLILVGPKRSGDLYAARERVWLGATVERAARRLERFAADEVIEQGTGLRDRLARYVPGAVQHALEAGADLPAREREVSILFIDIRGYTSFSESRTPDQIFEAVSRYTECASAVVVRHGGSVVEFHGDGLMAVFGAPRELADKEARAVAAAREAVAEVAALDLPGARLEAGVGVATGPAFVGNIQSVDRVIWGAIGNTTNLAARLQGQTRELDAAIAVDEATHAAAAEAAHGFRDRGLLPIRGRSAPVRVYSLARQSSDEGD